MMSNVKWHSLILLALLLSEGPFWVAYCHTGPDSGWKTLWGALSIIIVPTLIVYTVILLMVFLIRKWLGHEDKIGE